jgi:hypothetical protein
MRAALVGTFILAASLLHAAQRDYSHLTLDQMVGAVLLDHARSVVELHHFTNHGPDLLPLDALFLSLKPSYARLTYKERCEFSLFAILFGELDASSSLCFKDLIKADAQKIRVDLAKIPDSALRDRFGISESAIKRFRDYLQNLKDVDEYWQM